MEEHPSYIVFAGVNGAGKSTLYRSGLWTENKERLKLPRVNSDEIIVENGWDWASKSDQTKAGRLALKQIKQYMSTGESFNQETTLSGRFTVKNIQRAAEQGYKIQLNYVGVQTPEIAISRIKHRVLTGGHDIDPEQVKKRYAESIRNLQAVLPYCEMVALYDNTCQLRLVGFWLKGVLYDCSDGYSDATWYKDILR